MKFIDKLISGQVKKEEINDYVDAWHDYGVLCKEQDLWDFLGFTYEEYKIWVEHPNKLMDIVNSRNPYEC